MGAFQQFAFLTVLAIIQIVSSYNPGTAWRSTNYIYGIQPLGTTWALGDEDMDTTNINTSYNEIKSSLTNVKAIYSTLDAFCALKTDGTIVVWGSSATAASTFPFEGVTNIIDVWSTDCAFLAINNFGKAYVWGDRQCGGELPSATLLDANIDKVWAAGNGFTVKLQNGQYTHWGSSALFVPSENSQQTYISEGICSPGCIEAFTCDSSTCQPLPVVSNSTIFTTIVSNDFSWAGLDANDDLVVWGTKKMGGDEVPEDTSGITSLYASSRAFTGLKSDGDIISWGSFIAENPTVLPTSVSNVVKIYSTQHSFLALKNDGTVIVWGDPISGGNQQDVPVGLTGVKKVWATSEAYVVLKQDNTCDGWGHVGFGGEVAQAVTQQGANVLSVTTNLDAAIAITGSGAPMPWGNETMVDAYFNGNVYPNVPSGGNYLATSIHMTDATNVVITETSQMYTWAPSSGNIVRYSSSDKTSIAFGSTRYVADSTTVKNFPGLPVAQLPVPQPQPSAVPTPMPSTRAPVPYIPPIPAPPMAGGSVAPTIVAPEGGGSDPNTSNKDADESSGSSPGNIIGIVLGVPLGLGVCYYIFTQYFKRDEEFKKDNKKKSSKSAGLDVESGSGKYEMKNSPNKAPNAPPPGKKAAIGFTQNPLRTPSKK